MYVREALGERERESRTYGGDEGGVESVVSVSEENTGLPDPAVSDQQQLEQQVIGLLGHHLVLPSAA